MQSAQRNTEWISFYEEFADSLLRYMGNRGELVSAIQSVFSKAGLKLPKLEAENPPADIDPFTVIGLFNKGITDKNRKTIMGAFAEEFGMSSPVPESFDGVPVLNNLNATFYRFRDDASRGENDIDNLWTLFGAAITFADAKTEENKDVFSSSFDAVKDLKGNRWKLTMGLYWIRPYSFLNLDSRNRWFIDEMSGFPEDIRAEVKALREVPQASEYLSICDRIAATFADGDYCFSDFPSLSHEAWIREHYEVHYIILRASKEETLKRAVERSKLDRKTNIELVETMWEQFCNLGIYESNVVDTTTYSIQETVSAVQEKIASRAALLS